MSEETKMSALDAYILIRDIASFLGIKPITCFKTIEKYYEQLMKEEEEKTNDR